MKPQKIKFVRNSYIKIGLLLIFSIFLGLCIEFISVYFHVINIEADAMNDLCIGIWSSQIVFSLLAETLISHMIDKNNKILSISENKVYMKIYKNKLGMTIFDIMQFCVMLSICSIIFVLLNFINVLVVVFIINAGFVLSCVFVLYKSVTEENKNDIYQQVKDYLKGELVQTNSTERINYFESIVEYSKIDKKVELYDMFSFLETNVYCESTVVKNYEYLNNINLIFFNSVAEIMERKYLVEEDSVDILQNFQRIVSKNLALSKPTDLLDKLLNLSRKLLKYYSDENAKIIFQITFDIGKGYYDSISFLEKNNETLSEIITEASENNRYLTATFIIESYINICKNFAVEPHFRLDTFFLHDFVNKVSEFKYNLLRGENIIYLLIDVYNHIEKHNFNLFCLENSRKYRKINYLNTFSNYFIYCYFKIINNSVINESQSEIATKDFIKKILRQYLEAETEFDVIIYEMVITQIAKCLAEKQSANIKVLLDEIINYQTFSESSSLLLDSLIFKLSFYFFYIIKLETAVTESGKQFVNNVIEKPLYQTRMSFKEVFFSLIKNNDFNAWKCYDREYQDVLYSGMDFTKHIKNLEVYSPLLRNECYSYILCYIMYSTDTLLERYECGDIKDIEYNLYSKIDSLIDFGDGKIYKAKSCKFIDDFCDLWQLSRVDDISSSNINKLLDELKINR